jgi:nucleoid-associated protein
MELQEAILHRIIKLENTAGPGSATVVPRTERLPIDDFLKQTSENVLHI